MSTNDLFFSFFSFFSACAAVWIQGAARTPHGLAIENDVVLYHAQGGVCAKLIRTRYVML